MKERIALYHEKKGQGLQEKLQEARDDPSDFEEHVDRILQQRLEERTAKHGDDAQRMDTYATELWEQHSPRGAKAALGMRAERQRRRHDAARDARRERR